MLNDIAEVFNNLDKLKFTQYTDPCNISIVDNFLPNTILHNCNLEIQNESIWDDSFVRVPRDYTTRIEYKTLDKTPVIELVINYFNGAKFVKWLENNFKYNGLITDPALEAGGVCKIPAGKTLTVHKDSNWNDRIKCNHVINACLYLQAGPNLEIGNQSFEIKPNRLICWEDPHLIPHGFRETLTEDRINIVIFYYVSNTQEPREIYGSYD